ncbi:uncharacterized protein LOC108090546 isoform X3 [Drosophila ficusphila]|uniref:uncharacterized protein LOC108090546 isoform X3 n=1 Tax=Drosophila ficusphila TaxID=30025 RepID=UPI0007E609D9|nr:uncharacterized protein LOC108090546 isoform X3 [Drosophila ficusphila]
MENRRNITDLPLEVLNRIFRYCGNTVNKVNLAQAHPYFVEAFVYHSRNAFKDIYYFTGISMSCWEFILPLCGSNVNLIKRTAYKTNDLSLDNLILQHCHNLKDISFKFDVEGLSYVSNFISDKKNSVKTLDLYFHGSRTSEDQIKLLEDLPDLPHLTKLRIKQTPSDDRTITSASSVRRSIINQGETLERLLFISGTTPYDGEGLLELVKGCRKLRYFLAPIHEVKFHLDLVKRLVTALGENGFTPDDPLELVMDEYFKLKWLCHWMKFTSNEKLINPRLSGPEEYKLKSPYW